MTEQSDTVTEVIDGRMSVYGDPVVEMPNVAKVWSGITGAEITAEMVPLMLIGYKLVRARQTPDYSDNSDDVEGYLDIFRKVVGPKMVHARSVSEYLAEIEKREAKRRRVAEGNARMSQREAARDLGLDSERLQLCAAGKDGECNHPSCPQLADHEPARSGRHCPIDTWGDGSEDKERIVGEEPLPGFEQQYDSSGAEQVSGSWVGGSWGQR